MQSRQDAAHNFSSFAKFSSDRFSGWQTDPVLLRSMEACIAEVEQELSLSAWALYWHKHWHNQSHHLAEGHLAAHLQEPCFWAAERMYSRRIMRSYSELESKYGLNDCFQIAFSQFQNILKTFRGDRGANLKTFASRCFESFIINCFRQQRAINICSDWQFLRKLPHNAFLETMHHQGLGENAIAQYRLAWNCFKRVYADRQLTPGQRSTRQNPAPTEATWQAITDLYNKERFSQLTGTAPTQPSETIQQWLKDIVDWSRAYLNPRETSLNVRRPGYESGELLDDLVSGVDTSLMEGLLAEEAAEERQQQWGQVNAMLQEAFQGLTPEFQDLLRLYYGPKPLKQKELADQMNMPQYKVSRRLGQARTKMLKALAKLSQAQWQVEPNQEAIAGMGDVLEEWLRQRAWE